MAVPRYGCLVRRDGSAADYSAFQKSRLPMDGILEPFFIGDLLEAVSKFI
jgi:hypothetical protein